MLHTVAGALISDFDARVVRVWLYEPSDSTLHRRVSAGPSATDIEIPRSRKGLPEYPYEVREVLDSREPFVKSGLASDPRFDTEWVYREGLATVAAFPLFVSGELHGVLVHFSATELPDEALTAIETLATIASISLNDVRLYAELAQSEERYRTFIERSSEGIWRETFDIPLPVELSENEQIEHVFHHLVLSEVNDPMARQYGYARGEELEGTPVREMIPQTSENLESMKVFARSGYQMSDMELMEYDRHGKVKYFSLDLVGIIEDGAIIEFWGTQRDITDRKLAEMALKEAEDKYRGLFENAVEGIFQSTPEGRLITANPALAHILGYCSPEELLAKVSEDKRRIYAKPEEREYMLGLLYDQGQVTDFETRYLRKDGSPVWVSLNVRAVPAAGFANHVLEGTVEDITERRQSEQTLNEIRRAERKRLARDLHDTALQDITYASQEMDVSRILSTDPAMVRRLSEGNEALRNAVSELRHAIYELREEDPGGRSFARSLEVLLERERRRAPGCEFSLSIEGDIQQVRQDSAAVAELLRILQEALANVRKHSRAEHLELKLRIDNEGMEATVTDDGIGFEPQKTPEGTGLQGMRERVAQIGGELAIYSVPTRGTKLKVTVHSQWILQSLRAP